MDMTNKEIAERLREIEDDIHPRNAVRKLALQLDPPLPKPGTVVWFPVDETHGIVSDQGMGVYNSSGELIAWDEVQEGTAPVATSLYDSLRLAMNNVIQFTEDYTAHIIDGNEDLVPPPAKGYLEGLRKAIDIMRQVKKMEADNAI